MFFELFEFYRTAIKKYICFSFCVLYNIPFMIDPLFQLFSSEFVGIKKLF